VEAAVGMAAAVVHRLITAGSFAALTAVCLAPATGTVRISYLFPVGMSARAYENLEL
jgi:hypothetical protein